jgi:hypothetical protein
MGKKKINYFVASELMRSNDLPEEMKNILHREPATYRIVKPESQMTAKEKRESRELTKRKEKITIVNAEQEKREIEVDLVEFDKQFWRYFIPCGTLEELNDFFEELNHFGIPYTVEPANGDDSPGHAKFLEINFGLEEIDGYVIYLEDSFLMDDEFEEEEAE